MIWKEQNIAGSLKRLLFESKVIDARKRSIDFQILVIFAVVKIEVGGQEEVIRSCKNAVQ